MLKSFRVLKGDSEQSVEGIDYPILLNLEQITSIKPINIVHQENIIAGFWIRLTSGKKYKATRIPSELRELLETEINLAPMNLNGEDTASASLIH